MVPFAPADAVMVKVVVGTGIREKEATTLLAWDIVVVHVLVPVHAPVQPATV